MILILAEVADKEPSLAFFALLGMIFAVLVGAAFRIRWWLCLLPLGLVIFINYAQVAELRTEPFGQQLINELGWARLAARFALLNAPIILVATLVMLATHRKSRHLHVTG